ncbi:MAG TPA: SH3 domain-containing protein [Pirellulales bacterium]|nr:SH3 domain-containing protein [Pirellulales bacterium]
MRFASGIAWIVCAILLPVVSVWNAADRASAADNFPYTAYTNSNEVYVRSGPGKNYFPTDKLPQGAAVEVYRQDPGGWLAIRPPQGSFSWVPADAIKPLGDHLAVVEKDHAMCFVGTRFSNAHDVHQVRLDKGEQVEIMDIKQLGDGAEAQSWCEIAPPSGEFRWVFGKFVERDPPTGLSHDDDGDRTTRRTASFDDDGASHGGTDAAMHPAQQTEWAPKGSGIIASSASASTRVDTGGVVKHDSNWQASKGSGMSSDPSQPPGDPFQTELNAIDFQVSQMVVDDPSMWEFTALRRRAEALLPSADTALERGRVRLVLNRIARFEDVKHRQDLLGEPGSATASALASHRPSVLPTDDPDRFDSVGKLTPVISQRPNAPTFALVDPSNQVVSFITPAPGVNLQPYVGKEVGVTGQRGFMPELQKPHVTAMHVNVLDDGPILR